MKKKKSWIEKKMDKEQDSLEKLEERNAIERDNLTLRLKAAAGSGATCKEATDVIHLTEHACTSCATVNCLRRKDLAGWDCEEWTIKQVRGGTNPLRDVRDYTPEELVDEIADLQDEEERRDENEE